MNVISLPLEDDLDIEMTLSQGKLAYTFERRGKRYGNAVKLTSRKSLDVATAAMQLFHNALKTKRAVDARDEAASQPKTKRAPKKTQ